MDTVASIKIPRLTGNKKEWFKLTGGTEFKNVGMQSEVGYSSVVDTPPIVLSGEQVVQNETIDNTRGDIYVLQDAYFSYEFVAIG